MSVAAPTSPILLALESRWQRALETAVARAPQISVLFSGGLDSSLVALGARDFTSVELVTVGVTGSPDLVAAERGAKILSLPWVSRTIDGPDLQRIVRMDSDLLAEARSVSRTVLIATALALETTTHSRVLCGQGADELFLGYAHFENLSATESGRRRDADLDHLLSSDWPASLELATRRGKTLRSPFLEAEFLSHARGIPLDHLLLGKGRKPLLRAAAISWGLPAELAGRPKRAFQYGSGIERLWRTMQRVPSARSSGRDDARARFVPDSATQ